MRLLFDQNLSHRLVGSLADLFPGCAHVRDHGLERADDEPIWEFARSSGFIIASKDDDFRQRAMLRGHPPKVLWLRVGNCSTQDLERLIRDRAPEVAAFAEDEGLAILMLSRPPPGKTR